MTETGRRATLSGLKYLYVPLQGDALAARAVFADIESGLAVLRLRRVGKRRGGGKRPGARGRLQKHRQLRRIARRDGLQKAPARPHPARCRVSPSPGTRRRAARTVRTRLPLAPFPYSRICAKEARRAPAASRHPPSGGKARRTERQPRRCCRRKRAVDDLKRARDELFPAVSAVR